MNNMEKYFKDCENYILQECKNRLCKINASDIDTSRFETEMKAISDNGYAPYFYLLKDIMDFAITERVLVISDGVTSYSFVSFLLGLTDINPIRKDYDMRFCYGYRLDKTPAIGLIAPAGFEVEVKKHLSEFFDKEEIHFINNGVYIGIADDSTDSHYEKYKECIGISYIEMDIDQPRRYKNLSPKEFKILRESIFNDETAFSFDTESQKEYIYDKLRGLFDFENSDDDLINNLKKIIANSEFIDQNVLIKTVALLRGTGVFSSNCGSNELDLNKPGYYTRDDIYKKTMEYCNDTGTSYTVMDRIRKGMGRLDQVQELLKNTGFSPAEINSIIKIKFLLPEGACIPLAKLICHLVESDDNQ